MCYRLSALTSLLGAFVDFAVRFDLERRESALLDRAPQQSQFGFAAGLKHHAGNARVEFEAHRLNVFDALDRALDAMASERSVGAADVDPRIRRCRVNLQPRSGALVRRLASRRDSQSRGGQIHCE